VSGRTGPDRQGVTPAGRAATRRAAERPRAARGAAGEAAVHGSLADPAKGNPAGIWARLPGRCLAQTARHRAEVCPRAEVCVPRGGAREAGTRAARAATAHRLVPACAGK